jgi:hypothetical protein
MSQQYNQPMPIHIYRNTKKKKIGCKIKTDKITGTTTTGDTVIGDLLDRNMILIPIAIDPFVPLAAPDQYPSNLSL